jgi:hypothetical protein
MRRTVLSEASNLKDLSHALLQPLVASGPVLPAAANNPLKLLRTPKALKVTEGPLSITSQSRIVAKNAVLKPSAEGSPDKGNMHWFDTSAARYFRVNNLKNRSNPAVHMVEVRAWKSGKSA